ncbi:hypothetical protein BX600DRAFT_536891 [Xylariales sp. PMI_506]|nr:hypothetical protein BX600DRAFT_536891 [Xylariales sp. PMI_506]
MSSIKNVTVVGASGHLGKFVLEKLLAAQKFNVRILKRIGSSSSYAPGAEVIEADYSSLESLQAGFHGQDAVVSLIGHIGVPTQTLMVDAAIAAGVKRFLPSNFGSNLANPNTRKLPVFGGKVAVEEYLIEKSKTSELSYTFVYTGGFLDYCLQNNVILDISNYQPTIYNGGNYFFSANTMPTIGDGIVGVLSHPTKTRNRTVYLSEIIVSQSQILSLAKQIAPDKPWAPINIDLGGLAAASTQKLFQGNHEYQTIMPIIIQSMLSPEFGGRFDENDNKLLGIEEKSEDLVVDLLRLLLK